MHAAHLACKLNAQFMDSKYVNSIMRVAEKGAGKSLYNSDILLWPFFVIQ